MNEKFPLSMLLDKQEVDEPNLEKENAISSKAGTNNSSPCNLKASQRTGKAQVLSMNLF